jgi:hypothetical protein
VGAAGLNLIEGWWRIFQRKAFAGQSLAEHHDIAYVTCIATDQLNRHAEPWSGDAYHHNATSGAVFRTAYEE